VKPLVPSSRLSAVLTLAAFAFGVGSVACSANVGAYEPTSTNSQRLAVVDVRVGQHVGDQTAQVDASARFVSVKEPGNPGDALGLLGLGYPTIPAGTCTLEGAEAPATSAAVRVDLRDLSPVSLELRGDDGYPTLVSLEPKAFPDVAGLVSGVVFVAPAASGAGAPRIAALHVGSGPAGEYELPDLPVKLQLVDAAIGEAGVYGIDARGLDIVASGMGTAPGDRLTFDLVRGGVLRARCGADATGRVKIDPVSLGGAGEVVLVVRAQRHVMRDEPLLGGVDARLERTLDLKLIVR
jgi:hypothetical protein